MRKIDKKNKIITIIILLPLLFIAQYYMFKLGIISPLIKGVDIKIIEGEYIQDIDKYVVKVGEKVVLSPGDYIKLPMYAKDPNIKFRILDNSKTIKLTDNSNKEKNTVIMEGLKTGYTSVAIMKNSRVLQKATILVVDPVVESLNISLNGSLKYVGDKGEFSSSVEVDYKEFNNTYDVTYESSNENVLKVDNNKVEAVGVGNATIYAKSKNKVEALRYNIVARVESIDIKNTYNIAIGQSIKLNPNIVTSPKNLKPPITTYSFAQSKLPIERCITIDEDGNIIGIREGKEKVLISCGVGKNRKTKTITINVKEESIENNAITNLYSTYSLQGNNLNIELSWDILSGATNYDIYIKNNNDPNSSYELYGSLTQESFIKKNKVKLSIEVGSDESNISYEIYVVGRNEAGISKPSNVIYITVRLEGDDEIEKPEQPNEPEIPGEMENPQWPNEVEKPDDSLMQQEPTTPDNSSEESE